MGRVRWRARTRPHAAMFRPPSIGLLVTALRLGAVQLPLLRVAAAPSSSAAAARAGVAGSCPINELRSFTLAAKTKVSPDSYVLR